MHCLSVENTPLGTGHLTCKVLEAIIDYCLKAIELHDCLHGYLFERGTGTAILEAKLAQPL